MTNETHHHHLNFDHLDNLIDNLSSFQFSMLSDLSCGKSIRQICDAEQIPHAAAKIAIDSILQAMEVSRISDAVFRYSLWIDEFEARLIEQPVS